MILWSILPVLVILFLFVLFAIFKVAARADQQLERQRDELIRANKRRKKTK